jgi:hypothetical protein
MNNAAQAFALARAAPIAVNGPEASHALGDGSMAIVAAVARPRASQVIDEQKLLDLAQFVRSPIQLFHSDEKERCMTSGIKVNPASREFWAEVRSAWNELPQSRRDEYQAKFADLSRLRKSRKAVSQPRRNSAALPAVTAGEDVGSGSAASSVGGQALQSLPTSLNLSDSTSGQQVSLVGAGGHGHDSAPPLRLEVLEKFLGLGVRGGGYHSTAERWTTMYDGLAANRRSLGPVASARPCPCICKSTMGRDRGFSFALKSCMRDIVKSLGGPAAL